MQSYKWAVQRLEQLLIICCDQYNATFLWSTWRNSRSVDRSEDYKDYIWDICRNFHFCFNFFTAIVLRYTVHKSQLTAKISSVRIKSSFYIFSLIFHPKKWTVKDGSGRFIVINDQFGYKIHIIIWFIFLKEFEFIVFSLRLPICDRQ